MRVSDFPKKYYFYFFLIILFGLSMRLYGIFNPLTEAWNIRQAQTAMMARNIYFDGINFLPTRLDFFGNSDGSVILEFPVMHVFTEYLYNFFGINESLGRLISITFYLLSSFVFLKLSLIFLSRNGALVALSIFTISPWNIFLGRAFMPEASMMFFYISSFYLFIQYVQKMRALHLCLGILSLSLAPLTKPPAGLIFVPIVSYISTSNIDKKTKIRLLYIILACLLPFFIWLIYANYTNANNANIPKNWGNWLDIVFGRGGLIGNWLSFEFYKNVSGSVIVFLMTPVVFIFSACGFLLALKKDSFSSINHWFFGCILFLFLLAQIEVIILSDFFAPPLALYAALFLEYNIGKFREQFSVFFVKIFSLIFLIFHCIGFFYFYQYMYDTKMRMPHVFEVERLLKKHFPENRYALIHQKMLLLVF